MDWSGACMMSASTRVAVCARAMGVSDARAAKTGISSASDMINARAIRFCIGPPDCGDTPSSFRRKPEPRTSSGFQGTGPRLARGGGEHCIDAQCGVPHLTLRLTRGPAVADCADWPEFLEALCV